ncbi:MAG: T9SS type B sorting domain-containing protein [Flavobacteriales bacterium]
MFIGLFVNSGIVKSQATCATADPFCTSSGVSFPASQNTTAPAGPNYGCLLTQPNPAWYYLNIATSGNIMINLSNSANVDIDFIIWGPFASQASMCTSIFNGSAGSGVDCSYSTAANEQVDIPNAVAGQWYMLLITNFSNQPTNITATAGNAAGVDGTTNCAILCDMTGLTANPGACVAGPNTFTLTGTISVQNPPTTGTLTITNSCGGSQTLNPPFATSINYSIPNIPANGANCSVTATFSADPTCTLTQNFTAPSCATPCAFSAININIGACVAATNTYTASGSVSFTNAPASGTLTITSSCGGSQTFNAPFTSPTNFSLAGINADGTPNCSITATFSAAPACTITSPIFTEPTCPCNMDYMDVNIGVCDPVTNTYPISGTLQFTSPPSTGQLIISTCEGLQQVFNAPFISPINYSIPGGTPGLATCAVTATFTANPGCTQTINFTPQPNCLCPAEAGTFTGTITGNSTNNYVLCFGDQINITSNNNFTYPNNVNDPTIPYNPGIWYMIYSCPPTITSGDITTDPCLEGVIEQSATFSDINDLFIINAFPPGTFTNNIIYVVPITMYDVTNGYYSVTNYGGYCYDLGQLFAIQYLPQITATGVENCAAGSVTVTVNGGLPALNGSQFTATNVTPANATLVNTTANNGGTIVFDGLTNGQMYSVTIQDENGCPITYSGGPFVGPASSSITPAGPFCSTDPAVALTGNPAGGTWSGTGITNAAIGIFDPSIAGIGTHTITYTPTGCVNPSTTSIVVSQNFDATITPVGPFCASNPPIILTAVSSGGTWSGPGITNAVTGQFSPAIAGPGNHVITYTVGTGSCADTETTTIQIIADADATVTPAGPFCIVDAPVNLVAAQPGGSWTGTGITNATNGTFDPSVAGAGSHTITYIISGACGDVGTSTIVVINQANSAITPAGPFCIDANQINLTAATAGGTWSGSGITDAITGTFNPSVAGVGTHTITYTIGGACGTSSTTTIIVNPLPVVSFVVDNASGCSPLTATLTNTTVPAGSSCQWLINGIPASNSCASYTNTFTVPGCYDVALVTTDNNGCTASLTSTNFVCVYANPIADFNFTPTNATVLSPVVQFNNQSQGATMYLWDFAGLATSVQTNPSFSFPDNDPANYVVCLTASTTGGCVDSVCKVVQIYDEFIVYVPNAFTPDLNHDAINTVFMPIVSGHDPNAYEFMIFDRWGELIFYSQNAGVGWDGTYKGQMCKQDVYVWKLKVKKQFNGEKKEFYGHVTLLK